MMTNAHGRRTSTPKKKESKPVGRPTDYNNQIADVICLRLADGESLRSICRQDDMPSMTTVWRWLYAHEEFSNQYARAREEQAETLADELVSIADEECAIVKHEGQDVEIKLDAVAVARNRLRIDTRKWVASKLKPKKFGDKAEEGANANDIAKAILELADRLPD